MNKKAPVLFTAKCIYKSLEGFDVVVCKVYIPKGQKLCDSHLLAKFNLEGKARYDSEDNWNMSALYEKDAVVAALRKASKL